MQTQLPFSHLEDFLSKVSLVRGDVSDSPSFTGTMDLDVASLAILQTLIGLKESQEALVPVSMHLSTLGTSTFSYHFPGYVPGSGWGYQDN